MQSYSLRADSFLSLTGDLSSVMAHCFTMCNKDYSLSHWFQVVHALQCVSGCMQLLVLFHLRKCGAHQQRHFYILIEQEQTSGE
jgi:hypothetical protein